MSIDTREKRASVVGINRLAGPSVTPNSGKDQEWRQEVAYSYSGILAAGAPSGRIMGALAGKGGLAGQGGIAGKGGGIAG